MRHKYILCERAFAGLDGRGQRIGISYNFLFEFQDIRIKNFMESESEGESSCIFEI
jgi:hypothetical protein